MDKDTQLSDVQFDAEHISLVFLSEIEKIMDKRGVKKSDLAKMLNTSKSYLTQLWNGDKVLSLQMVARIQIALNIKFKIKANEQQHTITG